MDGICGAREFATARLEELGFSVETIETPIHPVLLATRGDPSWPKLVIYGHYDVQPPDPLELWTTDPFVATEREGRLYGRGVLITKGRVHMCGMHPTQLNPNRPFITYLVEGEEIGSPIFAPFRGKEQHRRYALVSDTGSPG